VDAFAIVFVILNEVKDLLHRMSKADKSAAEDPSLRSG